MTDMERQLEAQTVEGEIGLVIDYEPGKVLAVDVLQAAMGMIEALDKLDEALLSSVDTSLEPVSVLNDIQHSSLTMSSFTTSTGKNGSAAYWSRASTACFRSLKQMHQRSR